MNNALFKGFLMQFVDKGNKFLYKKMKSDLLR